MHEGFVPFFPKDLRWFFLFTFCFLPGAAGTSLPRPLPAAPGDGALALCTGSTHLFSPFYPKTALIYRLSPILGCGTGPEVQGGQDGATGRAAGLQGGLGRPQLVWASLCAGGISASRLCSWSAFINVLGAVIVI